jgi:hypothetical protein
MGCYLGEVRQDEALELRRVLDLELGLEQLALRLHLLVPHLKCLRLQLRQSLVLVMKRSNRRMLFQQGQQLSSQVPSLRVRVLY